MTCSPNRAVVVGSAGQKPTMVAALPVLDRDQRLAGVLTSGDILRAGEPDAGITVAAAMTTPALAAAAYQDLAEVIAMLPGPRHALAAGARQRRPRAGHVQPW